MVTRSCWKSDQNYIVHVGGDTFCECHPDVTHAGTIYSSGSHCPTVGQQLYTQEEVDAIRSGVIICVDPERDPVPVRPLPKPLPPWRREAHWSRR